ncbi:hypothetical protein [Agaribacter flavus]|uniref:Uncharacterized protein n=1 Tax=Agaribacter flavus TaxID=1902781 RepID=A0ABV7FMK3_9ALTE
MKMLFSNLTLQAIVLTLVTALALALMLFATQPPRSSSPLANQNTLPLSAHIPTSPTVLTQSKEDLATTLSELKMHNALRVIKSQFQGKQEAKRHYLALNENEALIKHQVQKWEAEWVDKLNSK